MTLNEAILKIVNENSGGIKFINLVMDLFTMSVEERIRPKLPMSAEFSGIIEQACKDMPEVGMLDYGMVLGDDTQRVKTFVYTPLKHM